VGLPVYNGQKYVEQAIDSVLAQTFPAFELVISDNASTDRTRDICEGYAARDPRVRYVRYEENRGASWNFNNVFHLSRAPYFRWQCYDDYIGPTMLEDCVHVLDREPQVVLAYPRATIVDGNRNVIGVWSDEFETHGLRPHQRLRHYWHHKSRNEAQYGVYRREVLATTGLMGTIPYSDQILMAEMMLRGEFREIQEPSFFKRFHEEISTEAHDIYSLAGFLDPKNKNKVGLPRFKRFSEYVKAVSNTSLPPFEKLLCYRELATLTLMPGNWRRMAKDLSVAGVHKARTVLKQDVGSAKK
jgi:glycosyltransferase involved in cell wall biosynthesis